MSEHSSLPSSPAGPSSSPFLRKSQPPIPPPPPPETIQRDDYVAAEEARRRFAKRGLFSSVSLPSFHKRKARTRKRSASPSSSSIPQVEDFASVSDRPDLVSLAEASSLVAELDEDYDKDVYAWAVLYENQRGYVHHLS